MTSSPHTFDAASQQKLKQFFELGLKMGCVRDQLINLSQVGILPHARQLAACAAARLCDAPGGPTAVGYGGARGGGKTHWLFAQLGADDCQRLPGLKTLLLRKVGKSNLENFESFTQRLFHLLPHDFNASRGILTFPNGSSIILGHYQCEKDIDKYLGLEYDVIAVEEATQLTSRKYQDLSTCCRTSKPNWRPRIYSTTNPGDIGHQWYLEKFILPFQSGTESDTRFIPARVDDNAFIDPGYKLALSRLTGWQKNAWHKGEWDFPAGQFFKNFRPEVHVLGDDFRESIGVEWVAAMDYGYNHPTVVLLACFDHEGNLYVVDEHVARFWVPQRHGPAVKALFAGHRIYTSLEHLRECLLAQYPVHSTERDQLWHRLQSRVLSRFVAGADMFGSESNGHSIANQYRDLGFKLRPACMDRLSGWSALLHRFGDPAAGIKPTLFIHKRCRRLLESLPYLQHDPDRPGDILKTNINEEGIGGDDTADTLRYLVATKGIEVRQVKLRGL